MGPEPFPIPAYSRDGARRPAGSGGRPRGVMTRCRRPRRSRRAVPAVPPEAPRGRKMFGILTGPATFLHAYERPRRDRGALTQSWRARIAFAFLFPQRLRSRHGHPRSGLPQALPLAGSIGGAILGGGSARDLGPASSAPASARWSTAGSSSSLAPTQRIEGARAR